MRKNFPFFFVLYFFISLFCATHTHTHTHAAEQSSGDLPSRQSLSSGKERYYLGTGAKLSHYVLHYDLIHLRKKLLTDNRDPFSQSLREKMSRGGRQIGGVIYLNNLQIRAKIYKSINKYTSIFIKYISINIINYTLFRLLFYFLSNQTYVHIISPLLSVNYNK